MYFYLLIYFVFDRFQYTQLQQKMIRCLEHGWLALSFRKNSQSFTEAQSLRKRKVRAQNYENSLKTFWVLRRLTLKTSTMCK